MCRKTPVSFPRLPALTWGVHVLKCRWMTETVTWISLSRCDWIWRFVIHSQVSTLNWGSLGVQSAVTAPGWHGKSPVLCSFWMWPRSQSSAAQWLLSSYWAWDALQVPFQKGFRAILKTAASSSWTISEHISTFKVLRILESQKFDCLIYSLNIIWPWNQGGGEGTFY